MIASIVYQQCQFKVNTAVFLKTKICGEWLVYAEKVTYMLLVERKPIIWTNRVTLRLATLALHVYGFNMGVGLVHQDCRPVKPL